jgi:hypothetical protein
LEFTLEELRDLLEVRDALPEGSVDEVERQRLAERLAGYVVVAEQRAEGLREQLAAVETVTDRLRRESRRALWRRRSSRQG